MFNIQLNNQYKKRIKCRNQLNAVEAEHNKLKNLKLSINIISDQTEQQGTQKKKQLYFIRR